MARKPAPRKTPITSSTPPKPAETSVAAQTSESAEIASISVTVPHNTAITVRNLKNLSEQERNEFLEKAKTAKIGFVILNAPFKVRPGVPAAQPGPTGGPTGGE